MRILIADDEELTRNGMINGVDWQSFGITQIDSAADGLQALERAKAAPPDLLLTDVRMPRMDGIELSRRLRELSGDCPIIFMSGYSDKDYLKAAISLKAVSYVEKPFSMPELEDALTEAVTLVQTQNLQRQSVQLFQEEASSRLALALTIPGGLTHLDDAARERGGALSPNQYFTTLILRRNQGLSFVSGEMLRDFFDQARRCLAPYHISELHTIKQGTYVIIHLYGEKKLTPRILSDIYGQLRDYLRSRDIGQFHLISGDVQRGFEQVYKSYRTAVLLLQSSFFSPYDSIVAPWQEERTVNPGYLRQFPDRFSDALDKKDEAAVLSLADELADALAGNRNLLPDQARDLYYKLSLQLSEQRRLSRISTGDTAKNTLEEINSCPSFAELHALLCDAIHQHFNLQQQEGQDSSTLFLVKEYIGTNFSNEGLSIKDISAHVHLSASYLCTIFKTQTGQTLNQYLTGFRIDRAKEMLRDPRNKVNQVAQEVGYADCNYFGKTFKKVVGLSPSEYREQELS
jgi:two-component system response regulator YesN